MLTQLIEKAADRAETDGIVIDGEPCGAVHQWVVQNCRCKESQVFFVVFLLTAELADREARRQGYRNQFHRALNKKGN